MNHWFGWVPRWFCVLIIVVLVIVVIWCWFEPCPETPTGTDLPATLIAGDHAGVWMPIDNAFTKPEELSWPEWKDKRMGFLFQLGGFYRLLEDGGRIPYNLANHVIFAAPDGTEVRLAPGIDFDWINLVGEYMGKPADPIDRGFADGLYPASYAGAKVTDCGPADACPHAYPPPSPWSCDDDPIKTLPQPCLRMRSVHAYFEPKAIVTYWQGPNGHDLRVREDSTGHIYNEFVFKDPITVFVWNGSKQNPNDVETQIRNLGPEMIVRLQDPAEAPHEEAHDPPTGIKPK